MQANKYLPIPLNNQALSQAINFYYQTPDSNRVPEIIDAARSEGKLGECKLITHIQEDRLSLDNTKFAPSIAVLSQLFKKHSAHVGDWVDKYKQLPVPALKGLLEAVWLSNSPEGNSTLTKLSNSTHEIASFAADLLKQPPFDLEQFIPKNHYGFDLLWSAFAVTGNIHYVENLFECIPTVQQNPHYTPKEKDALLISLYLSIKSQCEQHPQVKDCLLTYCSTNADNLEPFLKALKDDVMPLKMSSFTVQQMFPENARPSDLKNKATEIANIVFGPVESPTFADCAQYAQKHLDRLSRNVDFPEANHLLNTIMGYGISDKGLKRIAEIYGYDLNIVNFADGKMISLSTMKQNFVHPTESTNANSWCSIS